MKTVPAKSHHSINLFMKKVPMSYIFVYQLTYFKFGRAYFVCCLAVLFVRYLSIVASYSVELVLANCGRGDSVSSGGHIFHEARRS